LALVAHIKVNMNGAILIVIDGLGIALPGPGNAYFLANATNFASYYQKYPHTQLKASGESVGLPADEVGSTEVGHINLGAGRIVYQSLPRINLSIADGTFFKNTAFLNAIEHVKKNNSKLHLVGLVGGGTVHASSSHLYALLYLCKENNITDVNVHVITDGRDSPPKAAITYIKDLQEKIDQIGVGQIVSVMGRYYAMDRDNRWERVERAYRCLTEAMGDKKTSWRDVIEDSYKNNKSDEFIEPTNILINDQLKLIEKNDSVIFYNFRIDRPRELTKAFVLDNFEQDANKKSFDPYDIKYYRKHIIDEASQVNPPFNRGIKIPNLYFVMMTQFEKNLPADCAFPPHVVKVPLGRIVSEKGYPQLRMAESEKERFVTYYFNGLRSAPFPMEDRIIIPSPKVATYDLQPEMSANELTNELVNRINEETYKFILINYANPDMVGHTGNLQAAIKSIDCINTCVDKVVNAALMHDYTVVITADHGNVEEMVDSITGGVSTEHSANPVPLIIINKQFEGKPATLQSGILADVAPTILSLLNIPKPNEMTGRNLLEELNQSLGS